jgi:type III secretion protein Q
MHAVPATAPSPVGSIAFALPRIDPEDVHWSQVLHDARFGRLLVQHCPGVVLSPAAAPTTDTERYVVGLTDGNSSLRVEISRCDHPALAMAVGQPDCHGTQRLAATVLCAVPLELLMALGLGRWAPTGLTRVDARTATEPASGWVALRCDGRCLCLLRIGGASALLRRAIEALIDAQSPPSAHLRAWAVPGRIVLHQQAYSVALMRTLALGDVLLMRPIPDAENGLAVHVRWGLASDRYLQTKAILKATHMQIQVTPGLSADENLQNVADTEHRSADSIDELTLPVRFEIETVAMALGEIASIRPGYIIELSTPITSAAIRLIACGQVVGHAELVAVGGQLGARITQMVE